MKTWSVLHFLPKKIIPAILFIVVVFFGLVAVIYEENNRYEDKIARQLPAEEVALYLHADKNDKTTALWQSLPPVLIDPWYQLYPEFFSDWEYVRNLTESEYAFVLWRNQDNFNPVWLLYWPANNSEQFRSDQEFSRFQDVIILGKEALAVATMLAASVNNSQSLFDYFHAKDSRSAGAAYAYVDFDIWLSQQNDFFTQGRWQLQIKPSQIEALSLDYTSDNQHILYDSDWLQIFFNEYLVWQKLNPTDIKIILEQDWLLPTSREQFTRFTTMTNFDTNNFITQLSGPSDLVVSTTGNDFMYWLVRTTWSDNLLTEINTNIKQLIGFESPTLATSTLPDGTFAREYKAIPRDFIYQSLQQNSQDVQIVYLNNQDYFMWIKQGDYLIFGNSLKLLNRYLSKSLLPNVKKQDCLMPGGKGVLIGNGLVNGLENPMIIREIWSKRSLKYFFCY